MNCEASSSFEGVSSVHRILTAKIRLSLRKNATRTATTKHYDWALLNNRDIRDKYVLELRNRFEALHEKTEKRYPKWRIWEFRQRTRRGNSEKTNTIITNNMDAIIWIQVFFYNNRVVNMYNFKQRILIQNEGIQQYGTKYCSLIWIILNRSICLIQESITDTITPD